MMQHLKAKYMTTTRMSATSSLLPTHHNNKFLSSSYDGDIFCLSASPSKHKKRRPRIRRILRPNTTCSNEPPRAQPVPTTISLLSSSSASSTSFYESYHHQQKSAEESLFPCEETTTAALFQLPNHGVITTFATTILHFAFWILILIVFLEAFFFCGSTTSILKEPSSSSLLQRQQLLKSKLQEIEHASDILNDSVNTSIGLLRKAQHLIEKEKESIITNKNKPDSNNIPTKEERTTRLDDEYDSIVKELRMHHTSFIMQQQQQQQKSALAAKS